MAEQDESGKIDRYKFYLTTIGKICLSVLLLSFVFSAHQVMFFTGGKNVTCTVQSKEVYYKGVGDIDSGLSYPVYRVEATGDGCGTLHPVGNTLFNNGKKLYESLEAGKTYSMDTFGCLKTNVIKATEKK